MLCCEAELFCQIRIMFYVLCDWEIMIIVELMLHFEIPSTEDNDDDNDGIPDDEEDDDDDEGEL